MSEVQAQVLSFETDFEGTGPSSILKVPVATTSPARLQKEQQSAEGEDGVSTSRHVEPRVAPVDLLNFYDTNVWHRRCIKVKAALICALGWELVTDEVDKEPDAAHKEITALLNSPNDDPTETFTEICFRFMVDHLAIGNGYMEASRNLKQQVAKLYHIRGMTVRRDRNLKSGGYWQGIRNNTYPNFFNRFGQGHLRPDRNELLHYFTYDPKSDYYGMGEWYPALADMIMDRSIAEYYINLFNNQLMARFAIIVEGGKLSKEALKSVKNFIKNNHSGIDNAGGCIYLNSETNGVSIKIEKLNIDFGRDSYGISNLRKENREFVISAHGVPPRMVGVISGGQLGGGGEIQGQLATFKETEINPEQNKFESFLNNTVLASFGEHGWQIKFGELDTTDEKVVAETLKSLKDAGFITVDEGREELGRGPMEDDQGPPEDPVQVLGNLSVLGQQLEALRKSLQSSEDPPTAL